RQHAELLELNAEQLAVRAVVVDDQHAPSFERRRRDTTQLRAVRARPAEACREPEERADILSALDADLTPHELDELTDDRQPETCTAEAPRRRSIDLREWLKKRPHTVRRNTHAGIAYLAAHEGTFVVRFQDADFDRDFAFCCELDRVAAQV